MKRHGTAPDGQTVEFAHVRVGLGEHRVEIAPLLNAYKSRIKLNKKRKREKQSKEHVPSGVADTCVALCRL